MFGTLAVRATTSVLIAASMGAAAHAGGGMVLRDDLQRDVSIARYPQRVVTLIPSLTETVCALGACDRLVATDRYSNWPAGVSALPKAGGLDDPSIELIVSLKPDLVLISGSQRISARLGELGLVAFALNTQSYADALHAVSVIGQLLGLDERAAALNAAIERRVHDIAEQAVGRRHGASPTVYFELDRTPYAAGPQSFIGEMLARLGTRNIVTRDLGAFPLLNPEYIVRHDPDVIFVERGDVNDLAGRPGWGQMRAVRERHVCAFSPEVNDTVVRAGPRVADGMQAMADCIDRIMESGRVSP
jgi:iron complex transport system substrate-binding protein